MADSSHLLRRSTRRSGNKGKSAAASTETTTYNVGDVVELETSAGVVSRGRLVSKLVASPAAAAASDGDDGRPQPTTDQGHSRRWRVRLDKTSAEGGGEAGGEERDVSESALGDIVGKAQPSGAEDDAGEAVPPSKKRAKTTPSASNMTTSPTPSASSSPTGADTATAMDPKKKLATGAGAATRRGTPPAASSQPEAANSAAATTSAASDSSLTPSDAVGGGPSASSRARASAREERSKRRQALLDHPVAEGTAISEAGSTGAGRNSSTGKHPSVATNARAALPPPLSSNHASTSRPSKKAKKSGINGHSNNGGSGSNHGSTHHAPSSTGPSASDVVVKIPMLTGTLFLYRGARRRAEFVRKY